MIHALTHKRAYETFLAADTVEKKMKLAFEYFTHDAPVVDSELQSELEKHYQGVGY